MNKKKNNFIKNTDVEDIFESPFLSEIDRLHKLSENYKDVDIVKAFSIYYGIEYTSSMKNLSGVDAVDALKIGQVYTGTVKSFAKGIIDFEPIGAKEFNIVCNESFSGCVDAVQNYLMNHDNKLLFEVRDRKNDVYTVSVINAYYKAWLSQIEKAINHEDFIDVHIEELVNGGYVGSTLITPLYELTGKNYTSRIFVPGSHIVLNIERNFDKWVGQDVKIVPQKFIEYKKDFRNGLVENCLVGSRKRVLQIIGNNNIYEMYNNFETAKKLAEVADRTELIRPIYQGTVTGIINSNGKTGIFIELDDKYITGLMPIDSYDLLDYKPGDVVEVCIKEFEIKKGKEPFIFTKRGENDKNGRILRTNVRVVFEKA